MGAVADHKRSRRRYFMAQRVTYGLLAIILFLYGMIAIRNFLYPIALAFLIAYLLFPIVNWLEKHHIPRILANFITIISVLGLIVALGLLGYSQIEPMVGNLPEMAKTGVDNLADIIANISSYFGFERMATRELVQERISNDLASGGEYLAGIFQATSSTIISILLMPVYIFLFLFYRTKFAYFLMQIAGRARRREVITILREISTVAARYMAGVLAVVLILCFLNSLGLWIMGAKFAIALGIMSAFFNLIPYFGTLLGGLVPLLFALLIQNDTGLALRIIILFIIIQFIENNILTPNIVGGRVKINPFFVITGLVASSMIWGIPGMLLVVPFLAIMRILFTHIDAMKPYAFLLGEEGTAKHSISVSGIKKWFGK